MESIKDFLFSRGMNTYPLNDAGFLSVLIFLGMEIVK